MLQVAPECMTIGSRSAVNRNFDRSFVWKHCVQTEQWLITAGGRIRCQRCQAMSKRSRLQCGSPAVSGKLVCVIHGGRSTGPRTEAGRVKCAQVKTVHGQSTRKIRLELSEELIQVAMLEEIARFSGMISGPRSRGRRPGYRKE
jgi:hypothetical protein